MHRILEIVCCILYVFLYFHSCSGSGTQDLFFFLYKQFDLNSHLLPCSLGGAAEQVVQITICSHLFSSETDTSRCSGSNFFVIDYSKQFFLGIPPSKVGHVCFKIKLHHIKQYLNYYQNLIGNIP